MSFRRYSVGKRSKLSSTIVRRLAWDSKRRKDLLKKFNGEAGSVHNNPLHAEPQAARFAKSVSFAAAR